MLDQSVHLFLGILILISLSGQFDTNTVGNILNTSAPEEFVESDVNTNISCSHFSLSKLSDDLHSSWSLLFVGKSLEFGVDSGDGSHLVGTRLLLLNLGFEISSLEGLFGLLFVLFLSGGGDLCLWLSGHFVPNYA